MWKLRSESLTGLIYFLHGPVEKIGNIVQVLKCSKVVQADQDTVVGNI